MSLASQVMPLALQVMSLASQVMPLALQGMTTIQHSAVLAMAAVSAGEHRKQTKKPQRYHISEACKYHSPISICRHIIADT